METHKLDNSADRSSIRNTDAKMVVGAKQLRKALQGGRARQVFLAKNADPTITEALAALCEKNAVPYIWVPSMNELGRQCGIEVGAAAAAAVH